MKFLSAAFILLLTSVSGAALAADGHHVGATATATSLSASYTDNQAKSDKKSAGSIHCACAVPMHFA